MGYEFNQQVVAESFQALYVERGRPLLARADLEARHELCEDLAQSLCEVCLQLHDRQRAGSAEILAQIQAGLLQPPSALPAQEAGWVATRIAELLQWPQPAPAAASAPPSA